ncbi:alpha/beta fold hydrolase [Nocardia sp. NPDC004278]
MSELVLLHGSWFDGRAWDGVATRLTAAGHPTAAPTLDGAGSLCRHVDSALDVVAHRGESVTLVAHSYSGVVATRRPDPSARVRVDCQCCRSGVRGYALIPAVRMAASSR